MHQKVAGIYKLKGVVKNYNWGGTHFLSNLLGQPNPDKKPMAEYWLGSHETTPAMVITDQGEKPLTDFIASNKEQILGTTVVKKFGGLPFLLKILDVKDMLSIQVHPSKHVAEIEFARENNLHVPLTAAHRNYKDENHKPELMVALGSFWLLHGFKPVEKLRATMQAIPELRSLLEIFDASGYDQLYKTVMEMPQQGVNELLRPLVRRTIDAYQSDQFAKEVEDFWAARAAITFNREGRIDRGIFSIYFFNLVHLSEGEGIFQDAGVPHAYLEGQNVEIMANSDNVLRGGLTTKHIDVTELMKNVRFEETIPRVLHSAGSKDGEEKYKTAAPDFRLSRFHLRKGNAASFQSVTGEILLVLRGQVLASSADQEIALNEGEAAFVIANQRIGLKARSDTDVYRASVPIHDSE